MVATALRYLVSQVPGLTAPAQICLKTAVKKTAIHKYLIRFCLSI